MSGRLHARYANVLRSFSCAATLALLGVALSGCGADTTGVFQSETGGSQGSTSTGSASTGTGGNGGGGVGGAGAAGGAGGSSTSSTGGMGGGSGGAEDCLDGKDNDGDGQVDCADSDCTAGYTCVDAAPQGWEGYFLVEQGDYPIADPACATGTTPQVFYAEPAGPAECSACTCGDLQGAACSPPQLSCYSGGQCGGNAIDWTQALADGTCQKPTNLLPNGGFTGLSCKQTGQAQVKSAGSCAPSTSELTNKDPWKREIVACASPGAGKGCGGKSACVPKPVEAGQSVCIRRDGAEACPAGWTAAVQVFQNGTDSRACGACECAAQTSCAGGVYTFHDTNGCTPAGAGNTPPIDVNDGTCRNVGGQLDQGSWSAQATLPQPQGACTPKGGAPSGAMQPEGPVTFCCR
jgi:hypothetical protein